MIELLGYMCAILMGGVLGLLGGGGSILAVPILVFLFSFDGAQATQASLWIVGVVAAQSAFQYYRRGSVDLKISLSYLIPSSLGVLIARRWMIPALPESFQLGSMSISQSDVLLLTFALVMFGAGVSMLRSSRSTQVSKKTNSISVPLASLSALVVGLVTGFVGAGGGFLIVPTLLKLGMNMNRAIGTSLAIITVNSLFGFTSDLIAGAQVEWSVILVFTLLALIGARVGVHVSSKIKPEKLKKIFAYFVLVVALLLTGSHIDYFK